MAKRIPITRGNKFYSQEDFDLDQEFARDFIESDINQTVVLFAVDTGLSDTNEYYAETQKGQLRLKDPVELKIYGRIEPAELKSMNANGTMIQQIGGKFTFQVYTKQLEELDAEIKMGDYIGYAVTETDMRYYEVGNDGVKNFDNAHTILGFKPATRTIICNEVNPNTIRFK